jgi:hypothetical protein
MNDPIQNKPFDFRRKITKPSLLSFLSELEEKWCMSKADICWHFITEGIRKEKNKIEEIKEIKNTR